jgi:zinc transport system ATP-binding protein
MGIILSTKNLSFTYGNTDVFDDVSFDIERGSYVAVAGPNGAGKTTLIKVILGLEQRKSGQVVIPNRDKIGYLPQAVNVFNPLFPATAEEVVGLGLLSCKRYPRRLSKTDKTKVEETMKLLGIEELRDQLVARMSGGQQQRVFLARALVCDPELLILDEPSSALDIDTRERFFMLVERLNKENGLTVMLITHDTSDIGHFASHLIYLDKKLVFYGPFPEFCASQDMEKFFGSHAQHMICHQHD